MKGHHRPVERHRYISGFTFSLLVAAFVLFLLVALSLSIIKPIYLVVLRSTAPRSPPTSIATELRFGVWGVCATSDLNQPTLLSNGGLCFGPQLGYKVPPSISSLVGVSQSAVDTVQKALLVVLILHPISTGVAFFAVISSLLLASHCFAILTLVITILAAIISSTVLAIDLALVIVAKHEVANLDDFSFEVLFGNGVWMMVVAVTCTWISVLLLSARACYCCGVRRHHHHHHHHHGHHDSY